MTFSQRALVEEMERRDPMRRDPILAGYLAKREFAEIAHATMLTRCQTRSACSRTRGSRRSSRSRGLYDVTRLVARESRWPPLPATSSANGSTGRRAIVEMGRANDLMGLRAQRSPDPRKQPSRSARISKSLDARGRRLRTTSGGGRADVREHPGDRRNDRDGRATMGGGIGLGRRPCRALTVPAGMATGASAGFAAGSARSAFASEAGISYQQMIEQGYDPHAARKAAIGVGVVNASIEMILVRLRSAARSRRWA
jgi:hypothetical protein